MRIALCLSGQLRFVEQCYYESIRPNILSLVNVDVFIHTWNISPEQIGSPFLNGGGHPIGDPVKQTILEDTKALYSPIKMVVEPQIQFPQDLWADRLMPGIRSDHMLSMFYSIHYANRLKKLHEESNRFKYDWVIRTRFDVATPSGQLQIPQLDNTNMYIPHGGFDTSSGYLDSLAYSNSDNMDTYSDTFKNVHNILDNSDIRVCGEYVLRKHIDKNKIGVVEVGTHKLYR